MVAADSASLEFHRLQKLFTATPDVDDANLPSTLVLPDEPPSQTPPLPQRSGPPEQKPPSNATSGVDHTGTLKLQVSTFSYSQAYLGETQKDPDTSVDGSSQSQDRPDSNGSYGRFPGFPNRPVSSAGLEALVEEIETSEEKASYFDESRRFGSPEKTQRTGSVTPKPNKVANSLPGLDLAKDIIPMGLTQLFNNTQGSPPPPPKTPACTQKLGLRMNNVAGESPCPEKSPLKTPPLPENVVPESEDVYYSIAQSQEARERRMRVLPKKGARSMDDSSDDELTALINASKRKYLVAYAKRKNDEERRKALESLKNARNARKLKGNKGSDNAVNVIKRQKQPKPPERDMEGILKRDRNSSRNKNERSRLIPDKQQGCIRPSLANNANKGQSNPSSATSGDAMDEESSPVLPPPLAQSESRSFLQQPEHRNAQRSRAVSEQPADVIASRIAEPLGESEWDTIHGIPNPISKRYQATSLRRKRLFNSMSEQTVKAVEDEINSNSMDEKSFAPTTLKSAKSSIRNLPPFNIPPPTKAAPLLTEQSTFSGLGMESLYEGSSSLPVPPTMVLCDSTPVRSSPPPLSMCNINTTTQVERSPSPEQRPSSGGKDVRTVSNLTNPRTPPITGVIGTDRVVETSPGNRQGGESSPFRALRSSPSYFNGPTATETDTDNDKTPRAARDDDTPVSENKRKREMQSHRIAKRAESVVPCSLPDDVGQAIAQTQVDRILDTDREGDTNMEQQPSDELREGRAENGEIGNESLQKKRKIDIGSGPKETPKSVAKLQTKRSSVSGSADKGKLAKDLSTKKTRPKPAPRLSIVASKSTTPVTGRASPDDQKPGENNSPGAPATSTHFYRVFAIFKDNKMHYHPATVVPTPNVALSHVKVVFDDGTEDVVDRSHVRRLSLKVGDIIKCDMVTMKKNLWVIVGFPSVEPFDANANDNPWNRFTDSEGHLSVFIRPKKKGPYPGDGEGSFGESMEVPITRIYIIKSLWGQFSQRNFNFHAISRQLSAGISPVVLSRPETPFSKDSRTTPLLPSATSVSKGLATAGTGKKSSTSGGRTTGIFSGMVFALTFGDNDFEKRAITAKILAHGGRILDRGFDEMFKPLGGTKHRSMTSNPTSSDTEKDMDSDADVNGSDEGLKPLLDTEEVGFACVIADKYCRRVKFLQALALGIPCLSGKWIEDCVKKNMILNWGMYLLPAGESTYLSGAIRSRVMPIFSAASSRFVSIIEERNKLLDGYCVLLVMGRRKKTREKRKPYHFLTHALGAKEVLQVSSVEEANEILKVGNGEGSCSRWDLVYVDAATNKSTGGKDKLWVGVPTVWRKPRVVDDEWVIQSLILGRLLEEP